MLLDVARIFECVCHLRPPPTSSSPEEGGAVGTLKPGSISLQWDPDPGPGALHGCVRDRFGGEDIGESKSFGFSLVIVNE
jgi:hypothetical protein